MTSARGRRHPLGVADTQPPVARVRARSRGVFVYTTIVNIIERPDGIKIASFFIVSDHRRPRSSRASLRSTELRVQRVEPDETARRFIDEAGRGRRDPHHRQPARIAGSRRSTRTSCARPASTHHLTADDAACCSSRSGPATRRSSATSCRSKASRSDGYRVLRAARLGDPERDCRAAPLHPRRNGTDPARLLRLDRRQPIVYLMKFLALRRRGHGPGHARSAAAERVGPAQAPTHPRGVSVSAAHAASVTAHSSTPRPFTAVTCSCSRS